MKPLILEYSEVKKSNNTENLYYRYDKSKNLNILNSTNESVFDLCSLVTQTTTKSFNEDTDNDSNNISVYCSTLTKTGNDEEQTSNDDTNVLNNVIIPNIITRTLTEVFREATDSD